MPTRDTRSPPNVTPQTRIPAILGLHESNPEMNDASPSLGDGWMVSDYYLWMHVLNGMGKSQEWVTSLHPEYLVDKFGKKDKMTSKLVDEEPNVWKPVQT